MEEEVDWNRTAVREEFTSQNSYRTSLKKRYGIVRESVAGGV